MKLQGLSVKTAILLCDNRTHPLHDRGRCRFIFHNRASYGVGCRRSADFVRPCVAPCFDTNIREKKLALFTSDLCGTLDNMIAGNKGTLFLRTAKRSLPELVTGWQGYIRSCRRIVAGWKKIGRNYSHLYRIFPIR